MSESELETAVLVSIAHGVLDRPALYALPTVRLLLLARVALRARLIDRREYDQMRDDYTRYGRVRTPKNLAPLGARRAPVLLGHDGEGTGAKR